MKKYPKNFIGLLALAAVGGCIAPAHQNFIPPAPVQPHVSDPDLTLVKKDVPKYYSFSFDRAELYFSTNHSQQTHAILSRGLCPEAISIFQKAPIGQTMKQNEWNKYLMTDKICPATGHPHFNNWQKFYQ